MLFTVEIKRWCRPSVLTTTTTIQATKQAFFSPVLLPQTEPDGTLTIA